MLTGKVILVTGSSRGIGQATAITLAKAGAQLIIHGRTVESLNNTKKSLLEIGVEPFQVIYDVTDEVAMKKGIMEIKKEFGRLDGLVNNAGIMYEGLLGMVKKETVQQMLNINVTAVLQQMQFASRLMTKNETSSIVNVSSIIGLQGAEG
ncbi:SDR family NAD(P)-dependent oxidoreductase, partial [Butyricicoccus sp. 1XD8-22]